MVPVQATLSQSHFSRALHNLRRKDLLKAIGKLVPCELCEDLLGIVWNREHMKHGRQGTLPANSHQS
jgi:hypothetical protein